MAVLKRGAILLPFVLSMLVVACSGAQAGNTGTGTPNGPTVTVTIHLGDAQQSPTPPLAAYQCGAWATNASPTTKTKVVGVYALFTQSVNGNPQGVDGAFAQATVYWPDGTTTNLTAVTTADGLAKFAVTINNKSAINGVTLITVNFSKNGTPSCAVAQDRAAFFTVVAPTPTPAHQRH
jgi:hypothetical protein